MKIEHEGQFIEYNEVNNRWHSECLSRPCQSLREAKDKIDAKIARKCKNPFVQFECFVADDWRRVDRALVTSVTDEGEFWVSKNGARSKQKHKSLFELSPENISAVNEIDSLITAIEKAGKRIDEIKKTLAPLAYPKPLEK